MDLQPFFFGPWPLFQFLNPIHIRWDLLDGGAARRKAATYTGTTQTQNKRTQTSMHPVFERVKTATVTFTYVFLLVLL
jgi:hypothetical protein